VSQFWQGGLIIDPSSGLKLVLDVIYGVNTSYIIVFVPLLSSFMMTHIENFLSLRYFWLIMILGVLDVVLRLNTAIYLNGKLLTKRRTIIQHYF